MVTDRSCLTLDMAVLRAANNPELRLLLMLPGTITPSDIPGFWRSGHDPVSLFRMRFQHSQDTVTGSAFVTLPKNPKVERRLMIAQRNAEQAYYYSYSYQCVLRGRCVSSGRTQTIECRKANPRVFRGERTNWTVRRRRIMRSGRLHHNSGLCDEGWMAWYPRNEMIHLLGISRVGSNTVSLATERLYYCSKYLTID